jgi:IS5 family transposase
MYFLQAWYNLSDEMTEEEIYDSHAMKEFVKIDFLEEDVPDATTLLGFRRLLERRNLRQKLFERINEVLEKEGMIWRGGSIVDAAIIDAPTSTGNSGKSREPKTRQAKKGNGRYFGMKARIGVDAGTGTVHSAGFTAANGHDISGARRLARPYDKFVNAYAGYIGIQKRREIQSDEHLKGIQWRINEREGKRRVFESGLYKNVTEHLDWISLPRWEQEIEYQKSKVRSKVEHTFYIVKHLFKYRKARYRGLEKNGARLYMLFAMSKLLRWTWRIKSLGALPAVV